MTWTMADRSTFVDQLASLETGEGAAWRFILERLDAAIAEAAAVPGVDQVRAGLVRAFVTAGHPRAPDVIAGARAALDTYATSIQDAPPTLLQRRHPAWVGLTALELGLGADAAIAYARPGFEAYAGAQGDGEILWAMAEAAEDVGWTARRKALLDLAATASFLDPEPLYQVRLILALDAAEAEAPDAADRLRALVDDGDAHDRARIHAAWVLAAIQRDAGETADALRTLTVARDLVDPDEEPEIAERIDAALASLN